MRRTSVDHARVFLGLDQAVLELQKHPASFPPPPPLVPAYPPQG